MHNNNQEVVMMGDGLFASKDDYPRQTIVLNLDLDSVAKL
jgi:hypothetical protein